MIIFASPYDTMVNQIQLRNPELQDSVAVSVGTKVKTMMDGSVRTRHKTPATTRLSFRWIELTRIKTVELEEFIIAAAGQTVRLVDFNNIQWKGYFVTEPYSLVTGSRGLQVSDARAEATEFTVEFEGEMIG